MTTTPLLPSRRRGLAAFLFSLIPPLLYVPLGAVWALATGLAATAWAGRALTQALVYPHAYRGKRWALAGLIVAGAATYAALSDVAQDFMWRRAFQLTSGLARYEDPAAKWSALHPAEWGRQENRVGGTVTQIFRPSKITPVMEFSVTVRPDVGTEDLALIVEGFLMNLPKGGGMEVLEKEPATLPSGQSGYRMVYTDASRHIPLKSEILFILDRKKLYLLSIQATPLWFDRQRTYLEKILYSLSLPS